MNSATLYPLTEAGLSVRLPKRDPQSHKGTFGRVLMICGSRGMAGAALLSCEAAYRTGCGLVMNLSDEENRIIMQLGLPEALFRSFRPEDQSRTLTEALTWSSVIGCGCGLGTDSVALQILTELLHLLEKETSDSGIIRPLLLDADALNLLALHPELMDRLPASSVLTPHVGEMARLLQRKTSEVLADLEGCAVTLSQQTGCIVVMKDHRTVVTNGQQIYRNRTGNSGMATGGSGDVLSGVICGLLAQGCGAFEAACLGVWLHGQAGDLAAEEMGEYSMLARDLIRFLPGAIKFYNMGMSRV